MLKENRKKAKINKKKMNNKTMKTMKQNNRMLNLICRS